MIPVVLVIAGSLFAAGLFCLVARSNLIRMVMGLEFLGKGVSLIFILGGFIAGDVAVPQAVVFTLIAIEAVIAGLALALAIVLRRSYRTFDSSAILRQAGGGQ
jgi:multisubunit Na+/H+ antiporter MnhC subunit